MKSLILLAWVIGFLFLIWFTAFALTWLIGKIFKKDIQRQKQNDIAITVKNIQEHTVIKSDEVN